MQLRDQFGLRVLVARALKHALRYGLTLFYRHLVLLLCILRYSLSWIRFNYYSTTARACYRLSFIAAAVTYGIVIYKTFRAKQKVGAKYPTSAIGLLADENVQYFGKLVDLSIVH